jgi:Family of unknown function (DUF6289)
MKHIRVYVMAALVIASFASVSYGLGPELDRFYFADAAHTLPEVGEMFRSCSGHITRWGTETDYWRDEIFACEAPWSSQCQNCVWVYDHVECSPCP